MFSLKHFRIVLVLISVASMMRGADQKKVYLNDGKTYVTGLGYSDSLQFTVKATDGVVHHEVVIDPNDPHYQKQYAQFYKNFLNGTALPLNQRIAHGHAKLRAQQTHELITANAILAKICADQKTQLDRLQGNAKRRKSV